MSVSDWHQHLAGDGASLHGAGAVSHFGAKDRSPTESELATRVTVVSPLTDRGVLRARGADAAKFLQAQLTNDVDGVLDATFRLSAYCTPQGRMIGCYRLFRDGDGFLLSAPADVLPATKERLEYFRLRAQVSLELVTDAMVHVGIAGPEAERIASAAGFEPPPSRGGVTVRGNTRLARVGGSPDRFELIVPTAEAPSTWSALVGSGAERIGPAAWRLLEVRAAEPWIFAGTSEAFVPQMANLHALDGVSFTKGCFPGQEIVARLRYRGTLKRRTFRFRAEGLGAPAPGDPVVDGSGRALGKVLMSAPAPEPGAHELLAVVEIDAAASAELRLGDGRPLTSLDIPYDVERSFVDSPDR